MRENSRFPRSEPWSGAPVCGHVICRFRFAQWLITQRVTWWQFFTQNIQKIIDCLFDYYQIINTHLKMSFLRIIENSKINCDSKHFRWEILTPSILFKSNSLTLYPLNYLTYFLTKHYWVSLPRPITSSGWHYSAANTKYLYNICTMLDQRQRCFADVVEMLYKCFVFAGSYLQILVINKTSFSQ